jgi:hypothetical protein
MIRRSFLKLLLTSPLAFLFKTKEKNPIEFNLRYRDDFFCYVFTGKKEIDGVIYEVSSILDNTSYSVVKSAKKYIISELNKAPDNVDSWACIFEPK